MSGPVVKAPEYGGQRVQVAPIRPAERTAAPSAAMLGAGTGDAAIKVGLEIHQDEMLRQDQIATMEADRKLSEWENKRLYDPKDGAMNRRGKDAFGLPEQVNKDFDSAYDEINKGLSNDRQRQAFQRHAATRRMDINTSLNKYVMGEVRKFDDTETENYLKNSQQAAVLNSSNPERIGIEIDRQVATVRDYAKRNGLGTEYEKQKVAQVKSDTHVAVIDRMLANGQDMQADQYFKAVKTDIAGDDITKTEAKLKNAVTEGQGVRNSTDIWSRLGPKKDTDPANLDAMMEEARTKYGDDPKLLKATTDQLKERFNTFNASQRERKESNLSSVWDAVAQGQSLASIQRMPEYSTLPGQQKEIIKNHVIDRAYTLSQRGNAIKTDMETYYALFQKASTPATQQAFANENLLDYRSKLSDADFKHLSEVQGSIRKNDQTSTNRLIASQRTQNEIVNDAILGLGLDPTPNEKTPKEKREQVLTFRRVVRDTVAAQEARTGKNATDKEVQEIVDNLVVRGAVSGSGVAGIFQTQRRVYELKDGEDLVIRAADVPPGERKKIEGALQRQGRAVTDEAVVTLYSAKVMRLRGSAPAAPK